ncbi:MAG: FGLLP motif-containing membrane protein [Acidimicrobiales bacterium]
MTAWLTFAPLSAAASSVNVNIVRDGDFATPTASGKYQTFVGGKKLGPWHVSGNSVDLDSGSFIAPSTGATQDVDLSGTNYGGSSAGGLYQNLATVPGQQYLITYEEGGNDGGPPSVKNLTVSFGGKVLGTTNFVVGTSPAYARYTFDVVATSANSRLAFSSDVTTLWGPLLDDVRVVPTDASDVAPIAGSLGTPNQIFHSMGHNLINGSITVAAILFITFPSSIFNQTFSANYGEILLIMGSIRRRVRRVFGLRKKVNHPGAEPVSASVASAAVATAATEHVASVSAQNNAADMPGRSSRPWFCAVLVAGAIFGGLLNPTFGFNERTLADIGATLIAFALATYIGWLIATAFRKHHHYPVRTYLHALPLGLVVAAVCVLISRCTNFEPGYLYGVVVSVAFVETLEERHNAHLMAISALSMLGVGLVAWFLWIPVNHLALEHSHNVIFVVVDDALASIFVAGLVGTVIGLLPLEFMPGGTIAKWRKDVWAAVFFIALFLLVEVELRPAAGPTHPGGAPIVTVVVLFVLFGGGTMWMRHFFAKRNITKSDQVMPVPWSARSATDAPERPA